MSAPIPTIVTGPPPAIPLVPGATMTQKTYTVQADGTTSNTSVLSSQYQQSSGTIVPTSAVHAPPTKTDTALEILDKPRNSIGNISEYAKKEAALARETPVYSSNRVTIESHSTVAKAVAKDNWQGKLAKVLESQGAHIFLMTITFLDLIVTIIEMSVELLTGSNCPGHEHESTFVEVCHWISTTCLLLMCCDLFLRLITFGPMYFLGSCLHLFDAIVVIAATALDFALRSKEGEAVAGLLVALRFWRIIRVVDSVAISTKERDDAKREKVEEKLEESYEEQDKLRLALVLYHDRVHYLENAFHVNAKDMMAHDPNAPVPPTLEVLHPMNGTPAHTKPE